VVIANTGGGTLQVAIAISTDGGVHFGNAHLVSDPADGAKVDEPVAAVNPRTHEMWVAWTQKTPYRLMIRKLHYDPSGALTFDTPPTEIKGLPGLDEITIAVNATIAAGMFHGQKHVALAYADRYEKTSCTTQSLDYYVADSIDDGRSWQTAHIAHDDAWPACVTDAQIYNRNRPALAIANSFVVAMTQSSPTGSLVNVYDQEWPLSASPTRVGSWPPGDGKRHDQFGPAIAVTHSSDVSVPDARVAGAAVTWHDARLNTNGANLEQLIYGATSMGPNPFRNGVVSPKSGTIPNERVPWVTSQGPSVAVWGDYEGLAADDVSHTFVAAWADNRAGGDAEVWAAALDPF
jgi:hypothetical protein